MREYSRIVSESKDTDFFKRDCFGFAVRQERVRGGGGADYKMKDGETIRVSIPGMSKGGKDDDIDDGEDEDDVDKKDATIDLPELHHSDST